MQNVLSRRDFLSSIAATGVSVIEIPRAHGEDSDTKHWVTKKDDLDSIHIYVHGMGDLYGRNKIIEWTLPIIHARFRSLSVVRNVYERIGSKGYSLAAGVWEASNLGLHPTYTYGDLLWYQINVLKLPNSTDDTEPPFPNIHIYPYYEKSGTWAHVKGKDVGSVKVVYNEKTGNSKQSGEFYINVNKYHIGSVGFDERNPPKTNECDALNWSHVIAHEMLHNLGHLHAKDEYVDGRQMNAFDHSFYCNGLYKNQRIPHFT